jgi:hypothetical protein
LSSASVEGTQVIDFEFLERMDLEVEVRLAPRAVERVIAELDESGRARFALSSELVDGAGETVATALGTYHARSLRRA